MRWEKLRRSKNVENRRSESRNGQFRGRRGNGPTASFGAGGKTGAGGCLGIIVLIAIALIFKIDPSQLLNLSDGGGGGLLSDSQNQPSAYDPATEQEFNNMLEGIVGSTEDVWTDLFRQNGAQYRPAKVVNFKGATEMKIGGFAQSATGPFYLSAEETVYLDIDFFAQLKKMSRDRTRDYDFAPAYVIAHEIAHHVQKLTGYTDRVHDSQGKVSKTKYNQLSVRLELQADYLAGVWAHHANADYIARHGVSLLEEGDVEEAMRAAQAIGDDALQRQATGAEFAQSLSPMAPQNKGFVGSPKASKPEISQQQRPPSLSITASSKRIF